MNSLDRETEAHKGLDFFVNLSQSMMIQHMKLALIVVFSLPNMTNDLDPLADSLN